MATLFLAPSLFDLKGAARTLCYLFGGAAGVLTVLTDQSLGLETSGCVSGAWSGGHALCSHAAVSALGQPVELALVYVLLASQEGSYTTGLVYGVTGGMLTA